MRLRRLLLSISIVSAAVSTASAVNLFEEIGEELFDDVLRPILDIFPGSPPHPDYAGQGPHSIHYEEFWLLLTDEFFSF